MTTQYRRKAKLIVSSQTRTFDLSQMHFKFEVRAADVETPNHAAIRIYNLSDKNAPGAEADTIGQLINTDALEYIRVSLEAGYEDNAGVIFEGSVKQFRYGRENPTDTYFDLLCADGDDTYNFSVCKATMPPGSKPADRISKLVTALQTIEPATKAGYIPDFSGLEPTQLRPKVMWGMTKDVLRQEVSALGMSWSIQRGDLTIVPLDSFIPAEAVVLNSRTGMIGLPEQTDHGILIKCLINPQLEIGKLVKVNNTDVNQLINSAKNSVRPTQYSSRTAQQFAARVNLDGFYRIFALDHFGDTRGQEWYSELTCLAIKQAAVNPKIATPGAVLPYG